MTIYRPRHQHALTSGLLRRGSKARSELARKRYGPTIALDGLSLMVRSGAVHALLGENGAGKSTLVRLLSGLTQPDVGSVAVFDESVRINSPKNAHRLGIRTAFQEIS